MAGLTEQPLRLSTRLGTLLNVTEVRMAVRTLSAHTSLHTLFTPLLTPLFTPHFTPLSRRIRTGTAVS